MNFYQGTEELLEKNKLTDTDKKLAFVKQKITDFLNIKNIHFLFGAGVSSGSIPTMKNFIAKIEEQLSANEATLKIFQTLISNTDNNLESVLGVLYSKREYQKGIKQEDSDTENLINSTFAHRFQ